MPDYLTTWTEKENVWLEMVSTSEVDSNIVPINESAASKERSYLTSIEFTLNPVHPQLYSL